MILFIDISTAASTSTSKKIVQNITGLDILDDGYEWHIYGRHNITKHNPNARYVSIINSTQNTWIHIRKCFY